MNHATQEDQIVIAVYSDRPRGEQAVQTLQQTGIASEHLSLIAKSLESKPEVSAPAQLGDDTFRDAAQGAGLGGVVGLLAGATAFALSGVGLVFAAGPLAVGLAGTVVGAFLGAMRGWGVSDDHVSAYEKRIAGGDCLVAVSGPPDIVAKGHRILQESSPDDLQLHARTSADAPEVDDRDDSPLGPT